MLALPLHSRTFGRVMISICVRPASWLSAANELVRKRIWRISSRDGSRPPRNPLTWKVAPEPPVICRSASASSSGSSGSESISSCSSVVVCELPLRSSVTARSLTTTSSCKPAMPSVTFWLFAPRRRFTVASWAVEAGKLDVQLHRAGCEARHRRQTALVGHHGDRCAGRGRHDDRRVGDAGAGLVHDHETKLRLIGGLRRKRHGHQARGRGSGGARFIW